MNDQDITSILDLLANEAIPPGSVNLWPTIQSRFNPSQQHHTRPIFRSWRLVFSSSVFRQRWSLTFIFFLVAVSLVVFLFAHPQPVNAQKILDQAQSVANNLHANGIHSFEMISETTTTADIPSGTIGTANQAGEIRSQLHTWYQETNLWRYERRFFNFSNQEVTSRPQVTVADGKSIWSYDPDQNILQIHGGVFGSSGKGKGEEPGLYGMDGGLDAILGSVDQCYNPALVSEKAVIAGRKTYTIYLGPSKCPSVAAAAFDGPQTVWVDQETFFILRREIRDLNNESVIYSMTVTNIHYNLQIDSEIFSFTAPEGATIYDYRTNPSNPLSSPDTTIEPMLSPQSSLPDLPLVETNGTTFLVVPNLQIPKQPLGGDIIQDGPFTFDLHLYRDPVLGVNPVASSLYSDLEGIGIYSVWGYQGPNLAGPVTIYWGIEPNISALLSQANYVQEGVKQGDSDGRSGGLLLPQDSQPGDVIRVILKIETTQKIYGAVLNFTLKESAQGFEPTDISVQTLEASEEF